VQQSELLSERLVASIADFAHPPVTETMLGVWFEPPPNWGVQIFGMYLVAIRDRYPRFEMQLPVPGPSISPGTSTRAVYLAADTEHLVQLQNNMFFVNWRRTEPGTQYPRYHELHRQRFIEEWGDFGRFLGKENFARPVIVRAQVGYVNHVVLSGEQSFEDGLTAIFRNWKKLDDVAVTRNLTALNLNASYGFNDGEGTVSFWIQPAIRPSDNARVIQFQFAVMHSLTGQSDEELMRAIDQSHDALIRSFLELTTEEKRKEWGQRDARS